MSEPNKKMSIVARLREAREHAGLSQGQAARLLNMHRPTICEIEAGRRRVSAEELDRFARTYDVSVSWIIGESSDALDAETAGIELAARELAKLKKEDREIVMKLLRSLRREKGK